MKWFVRGVQSALFHYLSCAPCTGYMHRRKRRKEAKEEKKAREKLYREHPELYHHPEPSGTNPYWREEIKMGPGPPPRRARKTTTSTSASQRAITTSGTQSTGLSQGGSSIEFTPGDTHRRLSDDTIDEAVDDDNWNRRLYQREDEDLWGFDEPSGPERQGSSVGVTGVVTRPGTSTSSAKSYYTARIPPVNDLHPPIVSIPSPHPSDNHWMLQPPPKASVMSGKERATNRSRSGSGASSRVELNLQRQVSARQLRYKLERGEAPEMPMPPISRGSSYTNFQSGASAQRHDRPNSPFARPPSAASSRRKKSRDTAFASPAEVEHSSGNSSDTVPSTSSTKRGFTPCTNPAIPTVNIVRIRSSRPPLSTVVSHDSGEPPSTGHISLGPALENSLPAMPPPAKRALRRSTQSSDSIPYYTKHRAPLTSSDISSLNVLQDLVSPHALLNSRFVSAPLTEARIKLPPSDKDEETVLSGEREVTWAGSGFGISREWRTDQMDGEVTVPYDDNPAVPERDPRMRWSVDF